MGSKHLMVLYLLNLIFILYSLGFLGVLLTLVVSFGIYYGWQKYREGGEVIAQKLMISVPFIVAVIGVQSKFGMPQYTFVTAFFEATVFLVLAGTSEA